MMCRFFCVLFFCSILLTGCGVPDKALVLTGEELSVPSGESVSLDWTDGVDGAGETVAVSDSVSVAEQKILVYVCGAVAHPGVVELPAGSRAADALEAAGGLLEEAQSDYVNLAARLEDAQKLYFPTEEEAQKLVEEENIAAGNKVNINTAGVEQLCTLPGIGEARAGDIISYREQFGAFDSTEDLMQVPGIKQSTYGKLADKITVK